MPNSNTLLSNSKSLLILSNISAPTWHLIFTKRAGAENFWVLYSPLKADLGGEGGFV